MQTRNYQPEGIASSKAPLYLPSFPNNHSQGNTRSKPPPPSSLRPTRPPKFSIRMAPLLSSLTLIKIHSATLLPIAYYLLTSPSNLSDQNLVFMLGEAMGIPQPHPPSYSSHSSSSATTSSPLSSSSSSSTLFSEPNAATTLAGLLVSLLAISDLTALAALDEDNAIRWWSTAVLWRVAFFFGVVGSSYGFGSGLIGGSSSSSLGGGLFSRGGGVGAGGVGTSATSMGKGVELAGWQGALGNSLIFTWGFLEMVFWFWVSLSLSLCVFCSYLSGLYGDTGFLSSLLVAIGVC